MVHSQYFLTAILEAMFYVIRLWRKQLNHTVNPISIQEISKHVHVFYVVPRINCAFRCMTSLCRMLKYARGYNILRLTLNLFFFFEVLLKPMVQIRFKVCGYHFNIFPVTRLFASKLSKLP